MLGFLVRLSGVGAGAVCLAAACGGGGGGGGPCTPTSCPTGYHCGSSGICIPNGSGGSAGFGGSGGAFGGSSGLGGSSGTGGTGGLDGAPQVPDPVEPGAQPPPDPGLAPTPSAVLTVLALQELFLGDSDRNFAQDPQAWKTFGYNVDGILSTHNGSNHCKLAPGTVPSGVKPDGTDGIDNSFGKNLMPIIGALSSEPSYWITNAIQSGEFTVLLRMSDYEGGASDSGVPLWSYQGAPLGTTPSWDGFDSWPVTNESVYGGSTNQPKVVAQNSYVSNGTLVSSPAVGLLVLQLPFNGLALTLKIHQAVLSVELTGTGPAASGANGVIAGVLKPAEFINDLRNVIGAVEPTLCGAGSFDSIALQIEQASDIMLDGTNGDPNVTCDAISIGLGFSASAAMIGSVAPPAPPPPDPCAGT